MIFVQGVARKTHYYVWNVLWLVYFLNIITWCVFIIPSDGLSDRLSVSITIFLSELAFNLIISGVLPRVSYNTWFSIYFLANYLSVALQCLEHVFVFLIATQLEMDVAKKIDYCFACGFGVIHSVMLLFAYNISRAHNRKHKSAIELELKRIAAMIDLPDEDDAIVEDLHVEDVDVELSTPKAEKNFEGK